jgi:hypothetical protein
MQEAFRGYYPLSRADLDTLWWSGIFTFDANVLLKSMALLLTSNGLKNQSKSLDKHTHVDAKVIENEIRPAIARAQQLVKGCGG